MADYGLAGQVSAVNITAYEHLKACITGEPGSGKSWCAATAPKPIMFHDFDGRKASLAGKVGVEVISYKDFPETDRWPKFLSNIGMLTYKKQKGEAVPATNVLDSGTHGSNAILAYILGNDASMARELKTGMLKLKVPRNYDGWIADTMAIAQAIEQMFAIGHTILVLHERAEEAPDSKAEDKKFTGRYSVEPKRYKTLLSLFDEHWRCMPRGGKQFKILCRPSGVFTAKTAMNLDDEEDPNIEELIKKHLSRIPK